MAIKYYPNIPSILESEYGPYIAQAYAMRALMYFYIIRVWGDAPLTTTVWDGELSSMELPRTSVAEIKSQILSDIENAIKYFSPGIFNATAPLSRMRAGIKRPCDMRILSGGTGTCDPLLGAGRGNEHPGVLFFEHQGQIKKKHE